MKMNEIIDQTEDVDNLKFDSKKSYPQIKYKKSFSTHISDKTQQTVLERNRSNSLFPFQPNFRDVPHPKPKKSDISPSPMFLRLSHNMEEACLPQKISINSIPKSNSMSILTTEEDEQFDQELLDISQDISSPKSTVKLIQIQLKKDFFQINQTMVSKEYEDIFTSKRNERNAFLLGEKINKKRKSIWKKHIEKEMKAVNQALRKSLKSKNSISNEHDQTCSFSILRILESNAN